MKLVSISLSSGCVKQPPCTFCYHQRFKAMSVDKWKLTCAIDTITRAGPIDTVCYEYSGFGLGTILECWRFSNESKHFTVTTMPELGTPTFCGAIAKHGIEAIALSYDSQKCTPNEWCLKAKMIEDAGMKVTCNYLCENNRVNVPMVIQAR